MSDEEREAREVLEMVEALGFVDDAPSVRRRLGTLYAPHVGALVKEIDRLRKMLAGRHQGVAD